MSGCVSSLGFEESLVWFLMEMLLLCVDDEVLLVKCLLLRFVCSMCCCCVCCLHVWKVVGFRLPLHKG